jgi:hypothetical protein
VTIFNTETHITQIKQLKLQNTMHRGPAQHYFDAVLQPFFDVGCYFINPSGMGNSFTPFYSTITHIFNSLACKIKISHLIQQDFEVFAI